MPPRIRTPSALQPTKLIQLRPNRPINDVKHGPTKVQQRCQVNRNKSPSNLPENRSALSARRSTDCRIVKILNYFVLLSVCVVVFVSVASRLNIQFTNAIDGGRANIPVAVIIITRCYTRLPRKNRRQKPKKGLDHQPQELEPLETSPWVCCVFQ